MYTFVCSCVCVVSAHATTPAQKFNLNLHIKFAYKFLKQPTVGERKKIILVCVVL